MRNLTVALLQLTAADPELSASIAAGEAACRRAASLGADVALFPEMWSNGYTSHVPAELADHDLYRHPELWRDAAPAPSPVPDPVWRGDAVTADSPFVTHFRALAAELGIAIALTYLERWDGPPRNTVSLIDRHGTLVLTQAKVHTCAFALPETALTPGDAFRTAVLDTAVGDVSIGMMICYDREFPESARALMLGGAELVLTPNACELDHNRLAQFRTRALENMTGMAMTNYAGAGMGHSVAFDGVGYAAGRPRDMLLIEAGEQAGVYPAVFDLDALRAHRARESWGNAFRRPSAYQALTDTEVHAPFTRVDNSGHAPPR